MASNEKWKSVSVGIKTYKQLVKIAEEEDRKVGQQIANCLSPIGTVYYDENKKQYKIAGVSCLDYLSLYKLFTYTQLSSIGTSTSSNILEPQPPD